MEYYKTPLMEMYNSLVLLLADKNQEILESVNENKAYALGMIYNRKIDIEDFRAAIDKVEPMTPFKKGFQNDYNRIKEMISDIK